MPQSAAPDTRWSAADAQADSEIAGTGRDRGASGEARADETLAGETNGTEPRGTDEQAAESWLGESPAGPSSGASSILDWLPSLPATTPEWPSSPPPVAAVVPQPGGRLGEFELLHLLGQGGFGQVFLARQTSLHRLIALKITPDTGEEGRTLAQLEHPHIVQVYSETFDAESQRRLLCMQYVPGTTLADLIDKIHWRRPEDQSGAAMLEILDELPSPGTLFDAAALQERMELSQLDFVESVCWLGQRLARALSYAHHRGVLHLDIKPGNILINPYGRPLLADFNLAFQPLTQQQGRQALFGGTLGYMAPEHLDAFHSDHRALRADLDARCDLYSLGLVLWEILHGRLPFDPMPEDAASFAEGLRAMADQRRQPLDRALTDWSCGDERLDRMLRRCIEPQAADRFESADQLHDALSGCRYLRQVQRQLRRRDDHSALVNSFNHHTLSWLVALGLVPHLVGSAVQVAYNQLRILHDLSETHQRIFQKLVMGINPPLYTLCVAILLWICVPIFRQWNRVVRDEFYLDAAVDDARRRAVGLPWRVFWVGTAGWVVGMLLFPILLQLLGGPLPWNAWGHFIVSFVIAGLIANCYCGLLTELVVLRAIYPRCWFDVRNAEAKAANELATVEPRLRFLQFLAGTIPLCGALMMVGVGPQDFSPSEYNAFRVLVTLLIVFGMLGARLATLIVHRAGAVVRVIQRNKPAPE